MDIMIAILTGILVLITGYYAWQTRQTVVEMQRARHADEERAQIDREEARRLARQQNAEFNKRVQDQRRKDAARIMLQRLRRVIRSADPAHRAPWVSAEPEITYAMVEEVLDALDEYSFELDDDPELRDRLGILRNIGLVTIEHRDNTPPLHSGLQATWDRTQDSISELSAYVLNSDSKGGFRPDFPESAADTAEWMRNRMANERLTNDRFRDTPECGGAPRSC